jgi:hypothetical protein
MEVLEAGYDEFLSASAFAKDELAVDSGFVVKARIPSVAPAFAIAAAQILDVEDILSRGKEGKLRDKATNFLPYHEARRWAFDKGDDSLMSLEWCAEALSSCAGWDISAKFLRTWLWTAMKEGFKPERKSILRNSLIGGKRAIGTKHEGP